MLPGMSPVPAAHAGEPARSELGAWIDLETRLLLAGAEERRHPDLCAWRDRKHPRVWDRHLALALGPPVDPDEDVRALDAFYAETRVEQWSLLAPDGPWAEAWEDALVPLGLIAERELVLEKEARPDESGVEIDPALTLLEDPTALLGLVPLWRAVAEGTPGEAVVLDLVDLLRLRIAHGQEVGVLAAREGGELIASIVLTVAGERAWLEDLETRPDRRKRGHGRALMRAAEAVARRRGARSLGLKALESDWPWQWYEREGFRVAGAYRRLRRLR